MKILVFIGWQTWAIKNRPALTMPSVFIYGKLYPLPPTSLSIPTTHLDILLTVSFSTIPLAFCTTWVRWLSNSQTQLTQFLFTAPPHLYFDFPYPSQHAHLGPQTASITSFANIGCGGVIADSTNLRTSLFVDGDWQEAVLTDLPTSASFNVGHASKPFAVLDTKHIYTPSMVDTPKRRFRGGGKLLQDVVEVVCVCARDYLCHHLFCFSRCNSKKAFCFACVISYGDTHFPKCS